MVVTTHWIAMRPFPSEGQTIPPNGIPGLGNMWQFWKSDLPWDEVLRQIRKVDKADLEVRIRLSSV